MAKRILSIQSHVVSGYVGNKAAVFPLQLLGFEVDFVNSVHFSNHTGYPFITGTNQVLGSEQLKSLMDGLHSNHLNRFSHVLTGYVGSDSFLTQIATEVQRLKKIDPSLKYHCDPVLGDHDQFYVPQTLVQIYRQTVLPIADVITPNDFEVRTLTGEPCDSLENTLHALDKLHEMGPSVVVLSSIQFSESPKQLTSICSIRKDDKSIHRIRIDFPKLESSFTGTGDLFSSLFLAWTAKCGSEKYDLACEKAISTVHEVLKNTMALSDTKHKSVSNGDIHNGIASSDFTPPPELKLISSKHIIENAHVLFNSHVI